MKTTLWRVVVAACVILPIGAVYAQTPAPSSTGTQALRQSSGQAASGNAQAGKDLYLRYSCYACHGYAGHGGAGARLVPMRMALPSFTAYVRNPRQMPPYTSKVLTDAQLADMWAYIQALPKSPDPKRPAPGHRKDILHST